MRLIEQLRWWAAECDRTNFGCQARKLLLEAADALEQSPTIDAVPVVRCKDCKDWIRFTDESSNGVCRTAECIMYDNDFCSYGKRKDGDG